MSDTEQTPSIPAPDMSAMPASAGANRKNADILLDHAYDGIQEYDNPMPGWWKSVFWVCVVFAFGYFIHYQLSSNGNSVKDIYQAEVKVAAEEEAKRVAAEKITEESLAKLAKNEGMVLAGRATFEQKCATCHDQKGQGKIGPNLTDKYWIHGKGQLLDIYQVVYDGVPAKGMVAWGRTLKPIELRQVVAYVGSLRGTNLPGKTPEGNPIP